MTQINDLDLAKRTLLAGDYALVIANGGKLLFTSRETGMRPI